MFEHHQTERLIEALIANTQSHYQLMASITELQTNAQTLQQAVTDASARVTAQAQTPPLATQEQLDAVNATILAATPIAAGIDATPINPPPAPAA